MFEVRYHEVDAHLVTHRLIRNPNYGGKPSEVPGCCVIPINERAIKPKFFKALKASVDASGFRNPIILYATREGLLLSFGGSRLRVAKELKIRVPAIVVDYCGDFYGPFVTMDNFEEFFRDVPAYFEWTDIGIDTHYSLERMRREHYDPAGMAWVPEDNDFISEEFPWL